MRLRIRICARTCVPGPGDASKFQPEYAGKLNCYVVFLEGVLAPPAMTAGAASSARVRRSRYLPTP
jgi:hypothetical protein